MRINIFMWRNNAKKIIGSCEPWLVPTGGFRETRALLKFFFGNIDFSTFIPFISDIISGKSRYAFDSPTNLSTVYWTDYQPVNPILDGVRAYPILDGGAKKPPGLTLPFSV